MHAETLPNAAVTLWLVRHGQTVWNAASKLAGTTDVELTSLGREQACAIRAHLAEPSFDAVWSSDLVRAVDTARLAYGEPVKDPRLRELDFGQLEGAVWTELAPEHRDTLVDFDSFVAPGGESVEAMGARLTAFVGELPPGRHLIFTHGGVIRWFLNWVGDHQFVGNCTVVSMQWSPERKLLHLRLPS